jgi:NAD(P)H dehydrogenase (quinone)
MATNVAVVFYSATRNVHMLAEAIAEGGAETGAEVRLKRVVGPPCVLALGTSIAPRRRVNSAKPS